MYQLYFKKKYNRANKPSITLTWLKKKKNRTINGTDNTENLSWKEDFFKEMREWYSVEVTLELRPGGYMASSM